MNRRLLAMAVLVSSSFFAAEAVHAAPVALPVTMHAMFGKTKLVTFNVRNDSAAPLKLKAGDTVMTIDAGKTMSLKLPAGTSVTAEEATANYAAGAVIAQVSGDLNGVTLAVR